MTFDKLSQYSQPSYLMIGLDLTNELINQQNLLKLHEIFNKIKDCENFIEKQSDEKKIIVIISGHISLAEINQLEKYSNIDTIYQFVQSNDQNEQLKCIYMKKVTRPYTETIVELLKKFWFLVGLAFVVVLAALFPSIGASNGPLHAEYTLKWGCVIVIFLLSGLGLPTRTLKNELFHYRLHIFTQTFNLVFIPLIVFGICLLLAKTSFNKIFIAGIITMACTSTTISSNVIMTKNAGGNEAAALVNAVLGNVLGIVVSPALIWLFMSNSDLNVLNEPYRIQDYLNVLMNLSITVLIPLIVGQIIHFVWTEQVTILKQRFHFTELNSLALLCLLWSILCDLFQSDSFKKVKIIDILVIIILNASFYISFSLLAMFFARVPNVFRCCKRNQHNDNTPLLINSIDHHEKTWINRWRFSREDTIAIMFCGATKTVAKGVPLINAVNSAHNQQLIGLLALPLIFYHVEQLIIGAVEVFLLQYWMKSEYKRNTEEFIGKN
ncbi:unnamed protein product [Adineta ricciae]|uniref:Uncharacterized protein n=1 Tax=Adineta ricciae TaxID=249248 RepID=A0A815IKZ9_ADIRI|nr:unnamed protein product [Adineta ricciae]CAF1503755.1 unnamed protein product [Adineta ricciae]